MANIHELIDIIYSKFNESGEIAEVNLLSELSLFDSGKNNIKLYQGGDDEGIVDNIFFRWQYKNDEAIRQKLGCGSSFRAAVVKCKNDNNSFVLLPIHPVEGNSLEDRIKMVRTILDFFEVCGRKSPVKICLLSGSRKEWIKKDKLVEKVYRETEILEHNVLMNRRKILEIKFENAF